MATKQKTKKVKEPAGAPPQVLVQKIDVRKWVRTEQDIPKWRAAIRSFEAKNPRRRLLYNLYADVELDGHVQSVTSKRKDAVTGAKWQFLDKDGKPVDAVNELIDTLGFDELLQEIIASKFWGYSICEPRFWKGVDDTWEMSAGLLPRLHYMPEKGMVTYDSVGEAGINIREGLYLKTILEVGDAKDMGLYVIAAAYQILKRGGLGDYAAFIQTFGNPIIDAMWDGVDLKQKEQLQSALDGLGAGGNIIRPNGTTIEIKENRTKDTSDAHGSFLRFLNNEISKALLGTTETTEASTNSGYAQSKTHAEEDDDKHGTDITFVRKVLNSRFIRVLQAHGFDTKGGKFSVQEEDAKLTKKELFEMIVRAVKELGIPVEDDFIYELLNVPKPDNYDELKELIAERYAQRQKEVENEDDPPGNQNSKNKRQKTKGKKPDPKKEEKPVELADPEHEKKVVAEIQRKAAKFMKWVTNFFVEAPQDGAVQLTCSHTPITLAESDSVDSQALLKRIWEDKGKRIFDYLLFWETAQVLTKGFKEGYNKGNTVTLSENPSFAYGGDDPALLTAFEQNLFRFAGAKTLAQVQALNQIFRESSSFAEFERLASAQVEAFNKTWLETEYNTAVLTGEAAATYNRLLAQVDIFPYWEYRTAGDHLVRPAHAFLEGLILPANDPRWRKIFPPNGWNCRCYIVPRMAHEFDKRQLRAMRQKADQYLNSLQGKKETATGWGVNRADSREVFTSNQQYVRKFAGKANKDLNKLGFSDYGLDSYSNAKKTDLIAPEYVGEAKAFYEDLEVVDGVKSIKDYNKRPLAVKAKDFTRHTENDKKRRAHRVQHLEAMREALERPDEVWLNGKALRSLVYVKYYKGRTMIALGEIDKNGAGLKTWFELAEKREVITKFRRGLLVFKK